MYRWVGVMVIVHIAGNTVRDLGREGAWRGDDAIKFATKRVSHCVDAACHSFE